jgi:hypothetical protein
MPNQINASDTVIRSFKIHSATKAFNLIPSFTELVIYENLFESSLRANLTLLDSHNLTYKLPMVGEETIEIDISLSGLDDDSLSVKPPLFHINSIKDREFTKPKSQIVSLELVSEQYMSSIHSKVSKSYRDKTISQIVRDIHTTYLDDGNKPCVIESTDRIEKCIIPNLNPIEAITWLSKRAISENSSIVNYLFYETIDGTFFINLDTLIQAEPVLVFVIEPRVVDSAGVANLAAGKIRVEKFKFIRSFNKNKNTQRGVYASKLITHDITTKKITQYEYNGFNNWFAGNHLGMYPPLSNSDIETKSAGVSRTTYAPNEEANNFPTIDEKSLSSMIDSRVVFYPKHNQMYSINNTDLYDNKVEEWKLQRFADIGRYEGLNLYVEIAGMSNLRVGQIIDVVIPSPETSSQDSSSDKVNDKSLSGHFIITAIKHMFNKDNNKADYRMGVELSKDGLEEMVPYRESRKED